MNTPPEPRAQKPDEWTPVFADRWLWLWPSVAPLLVVVIMVSEGAAALAWVTGAVILIVGPIRILATLVTPQVRVDDHGLALRSWTGRWRSIPWSSITGLRIREFSWCSQLRVGHARRAWIRTLQLPVDTTELLALWIMRERHARLPDARHYDALVTRRVGMRYRHSTMTVHADRIEVHGWTPRTKERLVVERDTVEAIKLVPPSNPFSVPSLSPDAPTEQLGLDLTPERIVVSTDTGRINLWIDVDLCAVARLRDLGWDPTTRLT